MNVKQFFATNAREALHQVKREIGADAVILSNRRVEGGVEILAIPHAEARAFDNATREPVVAKSAGVRTAMNNSPAQHSQTVKVRMPVPAQAVAQSKLAQRDAADCGCTDPGAGFRADRTHRDPGNPVDARVDQ